MSEASQDNDESRPSAPKDKEAAVRLLYEAIVKSAREKRFDRAEALRNKLLEIAPFALLAIIRSAEIIEEEKSEAIDQDFKRKWEGLFHILSTDEANAIYFSLKTQRPQAQECLCQQGECNSRLYFINSGRLLVSYHQQGRDTALKILGPGEVAGVDTFFSSTFSTASISAFSQCDVSILERESLDRIAKEFPGIEGKLRGYCSPFDDIADVIRRKSLNRRSFDRYSISGKASLQLLDTQGTPMGATFKGELLDISVGGLSFFIHISKKDTAQLLLGRNLNIKATVSTKAYRQMLDQNGTIVALRTHPFGDYSVHVRFHEKINPALLLGLEVSQKKAT